MPRRNRRPAGLIGLQRGTYSDRADRNDWSYYDSATLDHLTTTFRLFQTPWSGAKTLDLTNMKTAGIIPQNQRFRIRQIVVQYWAAAARATFVKIHKILAETVLELIVNGKDASYQKPLSRIMGIDGGVELATGAANVVAEPLLSIIKAEKLRSQITLAANVPFEVRLTSTNASDASLDGDRIKVFLEGLLIRAM